MGFSLKKIVKSVTNPVSSVVNGVGKIASGKISEGLGDIGQTVVRNGLDIATGGNKKLVDGLSGGLLTTAEQAARGNTGDIAKLGVVAGATVAGGPVAGLMANSVISQGGNVFQAGLAGFGGTELGASPLGQLASNSLTGLFNGNPKPAPVVQEQFVSPAISYATPKSSNTVLIVGIAGGVLVLVLAMFLFLRKRR